MNSNSVQQILCKQVQQTKKVLTLCSYYIKASCTSFLVKCLSPGKNLCLLTNWGFPSSSAGKESACQCSRCKRLGFYPCVRKIPWRRKWQPTPVFLPGKFRGQDSLAGYSPSHHKESDTTEHTCLLKDQCQNLVYGR